MRMHLFEFEDLSWFPNTIRQGGTDYLRYFLNKTGYYLPAVPIIDALLKKSGECSVLDLCSGGGGNIEQICHALKDNHKEFSVLLTDKYPNRDAFAYLSARSDGRIGFTTVPVDALNVPAGLGGVRTLFSAIHHFRPADVQKLLRNAVDSRAPIAVFDGGNKHILTVFAILLLQPVTFLLWTPFFRPFSWWRILFTYLLPVIPLMTMWDGVVSVLRLYRPSDLLKLAMQAEAQSYHWEAGTVKNKTGMTVTYLTGYYKGA